MRASKILERSGNLGGDKKGLQRNDEKSRKKPPGATSPVAGPGLRVVADRCHTDVGYRAGHAADG